MDSGNKSKYDAKAREWNVRVKEADMMKISLPDDVYKIEGMTSKVKNEIEQSIENLQKDYLINIDSVVVGKMGRHDLFGAGPYLDEQGNLKFGLVLNEDVDYNMINKLIKHRYERGYFAGQSIEDYITHEMAHVMTYQDCTSEKEYQTRRMIIGKQFIEGISEYANKTKNGEESLAEAFVRYRNGEKLPISAEILVRTYIERWKK